MLPDRDCSAWESSKRWRCLLIHLKVTFHCSYCAFCLDICVLSETVDALIDLKASAFLTLIGSIFSGADALPNGLDVTFEVTEVKRLTGSYNTMVGNNEGSMVRSSKDLFNFLTIPWLVTGTGHTM